MKSFTIPHISEYKRGTNGHSFKRKGFLDIRGKTWASIIAIAVVTAILAYIAWYGSTVDKTIHAFNTLVYAKVPEYHAPNAHPTEHEQIVSYIKDIFGTSSDKAFLLLSCENKSLNPHALNDNTAWGGVGKDWGVFQINDTWQKTQAKFLLNWRINVQIAKQLYDENHGHFNLWSCGKRMDI